MNFRRITAPKVQKRPNLPRSKSHLFRREASKKNRYRSKATQRRPKKSSKICHIKSIAQKNLLVRRKRQNPLAQPDLGMLWFLYLS